MNSRQSQYAAARPIIEASSRIGVASAKETRLGVGVPYSFVAIPNCLQTAFAI